MNQKLLIYTGIVFLVVGILLRVYELADFMGLTLILFGVALKSTYIIWKIISQEYRIGYEIGFLLTGIFLFFFSKTLDVDYAQVLMILGIFLKVVFVVLFIRKLKQQRNSPK